MRNSLLTACMHFAVRLILMSLSFLLTAALTQAQTFSVLHSFTGGADGSNPLAGVAMDRGGNLYGTASLGGRGFGTVYKLAPHAGNWAVSPLYQFRGAPDGFYPEAGVTIAPDGSLYGTTFYGGESATGCLQGATETCGTAFHLQPPATVCPSALCPWIETQIYLFHTTPQFFFPNAGELVFDSAGNMYGAAFQGGTQTINGGVYEFSPSSGGWVETNLYGFPSHNSPGCCPIGGVTLDNSGNIYGTTSLPFQPSDLYGSVFQLQNSGAGWTETNLHLFQNGSDGAFPRAGLIADAAGNLYGTTSSGGAGNGGTVFELSPSQNGWVFNILYSFNGPSGRGPFSPLLMDAAGNLYGTTLAGGAFQQGAVFKLTNSNGVWTYASVHDFSGGNDGRSPYGHLLLDADGNLYGTAGWGGANDDGVVWELTGLSLR